MKLKMQQSQQVSGGTAVFSPFILLFFPTAFILFLLPAAAHSVLDP